MPACPQLNIKLNHNLSYFASLLQYGILLPLEKSTTILLLLLKLPGADLEYLQKEVQTIFIDGVAADDLEQKLFPGQTLAISAAMPGLAGAIFRKGGLHSTLRSSSVKDQIQPDATGYVNLKLFNSVATDLIVPLLKDGILLTGIHLFKFISRREELFRGETELKLDGSEISLEELLERLEDLPQIFLKMETTSF